MTPIKRKLLYIFRDSLLRLRITWNHGTNLTLSVGYHVDRTDSKGKPKWDGSRCIRNTTHGKDKVPASTINKVLEQLEDKIDKAFYAFEAEDMIPTKEMLKNSLSDKPDTTNETTFDQAFTEFLIYGETIKQWSEGTIKKMRTMRHLILKFRPNVVLADFNADFLNSLMAYQTNNAVVDAEKKSKKETIVKYKGKYQNSTINRNMRFIKWFVRWCDQKGYLTDSDFEKHKTNYKTPKNPIVFLNWDELMRVYNIDLSSRPDLELTRDMFCLCCFTSLRYSDLVNLHWSNIIDDQIHITTIKTTDSIIIDLNDYSREILNKYRNRMNEPLVFPKKSSQKMNDGLKKIGKECNINEPIRLVQMFGSERKELTLPKYELLTTHCGRRTFICNAISLGIPPNIIMQWTGHSDYNAMKPYIAIVDKNRKKSMELFNKKSGN